MAHGLPRVMQVKLEYDPTSSVHIIPILCLPCQTHCSCEWEGNSLLLVIYYVSPGKVISDFGEPETYREGNVARGRKLGMRCLVIFSLILSLIYSTNKY